MEVQTAGKRYAEYMPTRQFFAAALTVEHVSEVRSAAFVSQLPLGGNQDGYGIRIESKPLANEADSPGADRYTITPSYPSVMAIPLRSGRVFTPADREGATPVVMINETFARLNWPGENPIGERIKLGEKETPWRRIVGVLGDIRHAGLDKPSLRQIYIPQPQWQFADGSMILVARTSGDPDLLHKPDPRSDLVGRSQSADPGRRLDGGGRPPVHLGPPIRADALPRLRRCSPSCSLRRGSTASSRAASPSGPASSAFAPRSARPGGGCSGWWSARGSRSPG